MIIFKQITKVAAILTMAIWCGILMIQNNRMGGKILALETALAMETEMLNGKLFSEAVGVYEISGIPNKKPASMMSKGWK